MGKNRGFTLIELMIVLAILSILLTVAVPDFGLFVRQSEMDSVQSRLFSGASYARSEAVRRATTVTLCQRDPTDSKKCGTNWGNGWTIVVTDTNEALKVDDPVGSGATLTGTSSSLIFDYDGQLSGGGTVCFSVDDADASTDVRYLQVLATGRIRSWDGGTVCGI